MPAIDSSSADNEDLTVVVADLRRGAAALTAENHDLRTEIAELRLAASNDSNGDAPSHTLGKVAEIALRAGSGAPGAARMVTKYCLRGLVTQGTLDDAELLVSELVANSVVHAELGAGDAVRLSIYLAAHTLRFEIDNPGTVGVVARAPRPAGQPRAGGFGLELVERLAARWGVSREHSTNVWFELSRA
jgi:anti-sigma regulatory factor (Ser/Thr protein kinase)